MEPAILGVLAFMLTVMLYLDRTRRNDTRDLRQEMKAGFTELRKEIRSSAERTDARIDQLTTTVVNLAESLGQAKGRTETLVATE